MDLLGRDPNVDSVAVSVLVVVVPEFVLFCSVDVL